MPSAPGAGGTWCHRPGSSSRGYRGADRVSGCRGGGREPARNPSPCSRAARRDTCRSEEHTSELQSPYDLVCRLLLEKKNKNKLRDVFRILSDNRAQLEFCEHVVLAFADA